ncbi:MAG: type I DNA topoisomerase [Dehalococcoidia bacterium]|nr:type I DNA topoisomerase [Dehalococcoidia bacterium]
MTTQRRSSGTPRTTAARKAAATRAAVNKAAAAGATAGTPVASTARTTRATRAGTGVALVIVESPAKARTIAQYLGPEYIVESSIGHIRDLPSTAAEIPDDLKKDKWARLGVNVDEGFEPLYIVPANKKAQVAKLKALLKDASELYLATDEDREGEAIAWHLREVLNPRVPVRRMVFHEITRAAIQEALASPRDIDEELVAAQEARRILDRLYGYEVSPVLWKKVRPRLSAGRVQSAAVRLIVERERARMRFVKAGFWDVDASLVTRDGAEMVPTRLVHLDGSRIASGRDFDPTTGVLTSDAALLDEMKAQAVATALRGQPATVREVTERPFTQRPPAPFITSTLQQEAGRKLRYTAQRTMRVAQGLYENGYITYMRTDSTNLSTQAVEAARSQVRSLYGNEFLPDQPRTYASSKNAQEAHEAIRPAGEQFRTPDSLRRELDDDAFRLYDLIWKRTVAGQMRDATGLRTNVRLEATAGEHGLALLTTSGKVITFAGFLRAYVEGSDDPDAELEDQERVLPAMRDGQVLDTTDATAHGHETQPPARFTEASLVRELEERGIGRPSTYATIIQTVQDRGYVHKRGSALVPNFVAFAVTRLLEEHFPELVDLDFTARMEGQLDAVASGDLEARPWLKAFYFGGEGTPDEDRKSIGLKARISAGLGDIDAREVSSVVLGEDSQGREVAVRVGRYGPYVQAGDTTERASIPDETVPDEITLAKAIALLEEAALGDRELGTYPKTGDLIYVKTGRYGPYVQVGEDDSNGGKPKRGSLFPGMTIESVTREDALEILQFPKTLGTHPVTGEPITVQDGPNGPYMRMGAKDSRSLRDHDHMRSVDLDEAVRILAEPKRGRSFAAAAALKELGEHPTSKAPMRILKGRFGPYVTDGTVNASIPSGRDPATIEMDDALELLAAREQKMREQGIEPGARTPRRRTSTARAPRRRSA